MARILCTCPGRFGDILWALPTVRAIAETTGGLVDLHIGQEYGSLVPLLQSQPYIAHAESIAGWTGDRAVLEHGWAPPLDAPVYDRVFHLGYRRWPELPLPLEIDQTVRVDIELPPLDLTRSWISTPATEIRWFDAGYRHPRRIAVGFTDEYFELKYGLTELVNQHDSYWLLKPCMGQGRWFAEAGEGSHNWIEAVSLISQAEIFLGCCSALHVLAVALGIPVVLVEPMEARWNPIFYPLGMDGPRVTVVKGLDGRPTFDARHVCETLTARLGKEAAT